MISGEGEDFAALGIHIAGDQMPAQPELEILASNADAVSVFRYARADYLMGLGVAVYHGLAATEIKTVAEILELECNEDLLWRLRVLEGAYGKEVNKRSKGKNKR